MAGIYSQGGSAGHRYAGWLSEVEAKNFTFGGKVFNGSPSAIYVGSNLVLANWLTKATKQAILGAFGQRDGMAVINATDAYLTQLAASDMDKATALAGFINEDPMMVCSLPLTISITMPFRPLVGDGTAYIKTGYVPKTNTTIYTKIRADQQNGQYMFVYGSELSYNCTDRISLNRQNTGVFRLGICGADTTCGSFVLNTIYELVHKMLSFKVNGSVLATSSGTPTNGRYDMWIFWVNRGGSGVEQKFKGGISYWKAVEDVEKVEMYPFKLGKAWAAEDVSTGVAQAAGTCGMIDLVSGKFFPNANSSGSFTIPDISYTPSTP